MKLNLIPASASRGSGSKIAWVFAVAIIGASVYGAISMKAAGATALDQAKQDVSKWESASEKTISIASSADTIIAKSAGYRLNIQLANAMDAHNSVYPNFYDELFRYIPSYFRITSVQAVPSDENTCTVTMQGTIGSFQEYANLMLALLRIKGAQAVSRSGYQLVDTYVPPLNASDQVGRPLKLGEAPLPDDPIQRLDVKIASAGETNYVGQGGFGTFGTPKERGAMPGESLITVAVVLTGKHLFTPNPRETLAGAGSAFAAAGAGSADNGAAAGGS